VDGGTSVLFAQIHTLVFGGEGRAFHHFFMRSRIRDLVAMRHAGSKEQMEQYAPV
jgi:hypothetical protein